MPTEWCGNILPDEPVDKFELHWFSYNVIGDSSNIREYKAIYYVNSPYEEVHPNNGRAPALFNQWMGFEGGYPMGRWDGWLGVVNYPNPHRVATYKEAAEKSIAILMDSIYHYADRIDACQNAITLIQEKLDKVI